MTVAAAGLARRPDFDWALSLLSLAGAALCTWLLITDRSTQRRTEPGLPSVATLTLATSDVRRRANGTLAWNDLEAGAAVYDFDSVFVPPGSAASFTFEDGSQLDVEENSLVVIQRPAKGVGAQVELVRGIASGVAGTHGMAIRGADWVAALPVKTEAKVNVQPGKEPLVEVFAGSARVQTPSGAYPLEANQRGTITATGLSPASFTVALTSPPRGTRQYFQQAPGPIVLSWKESAETGLSVELAHDRAFTEIIEASPAIGGTRTFQPTLSGTFWWRVVGSAGAPRSETRKFDLVEDLAPIPSSPAPNEQIDTAFRAIPLAWSAIENAPLYRVEISRGEDFSALVFSAQVATNSLWVREPLPEGSYRWRVRTVHAERGESPFSEPRTFILIDTPLPDAPELIDSALEVMGGKKKQR